MTIFQCGQTVRDAIPSAASKGQPLKSFSKKWVSGKEVICELAASRLCKRVVPERGQPTTNIRGRQTLSLWICSFIPSHHFSTNCQEPVGSDPAIARCPP